MRLESARLDSVYGGVVPIAIQARDLAVRVEAYDVSVGNPSDLTLFARPGTSAGIVPPTNACTTMVFSSAWIISTISALKSGTACGKPRQICSRPPRIGTTLFLP